MFITRDHADLGCSSQNARDQWREKIESAKTLRKFDSESNRVSRLCRRRQYCLMALHSTLLFTRYTSLPR